MMQKMGWTEGKGLGINEDGLKEHVKVRLKENNFGLGADRRTIDNWLDNNSAFDALLKGMAGNEDVAAGSTATTTTTSTTTTTTTASVVERGDAAPPAPAAVTGRLYHRQKFRRNKAVSGFNAEQLSMILGVAHTPDAVPEPPSLPEVAAVEDNPLLTVAGTTVQDYFAQKMAERGMAAAPVGKSVAADKEQEDSEDDYDAPPSFGGLGLGASSAPSAPAAPSPAHYMSSVGFTMGGPGLSSFIKTVDVSVTETLMQAATTPAAAGHEAAPLMSPSSTVANDKAEKRARKEQVRAEKAERKQKRAEKRALKAAVSSDLPTPALSPVAEKKKKSKHVPEVVEEPLPVPAAKKKKKSTKEEPVTAELALDEKKLKRRREAEDDEIADTIPKIKREKKDKQKKEKTSSQTKVKKSKA
ncbi:PIN2/TERF1-interacting telomerase inhibitor 1 [Geranomyces michiganensis]|nr:PIN2/TERF1-interacting telomerase inhibitor 1 [Geranomyces michiganensis]